MMRPIFLSRYLVVDLTSTICLVVVAVAVGVEQRAGADLRYDLEVDFEEAALGSSRTLTLPVSTPCTACSGSGAEPGLLSRPVLRVEVAAKLVQAVVLYSFRKPVLPAEEQVKLSRPLSRVQWHWIC